MTHSKWLSHPEETVVRHSNPQPVCVCERESKRERDCVWLCVCVWEREHKRERLCLVVCVCVLWGFRLGYVSLIWTRFSVLVGSVRVSMRVDESTERETGKEGFPSKAYLLRKTSTQQEYSQDSNGFNGVEREQAAVFV